MLRGLPFTKLQGRWSGHSTVTSSGTSPEGGLLLLNLRRRLLLLARFLEFQQGYSFRYTYCMPMHKINIMDA